MTETSFQKAERIKAEVAEKYGFTIDKLLYGPRNEALSLARFETMFRLRHETEMGGKSLQWIGARMAGRDHSTIHAGIKRHLDLTKALVQ